MKINEHVKIIAIMTVAVLAIYFVVDIPTKSMEENDVMFPGVIGDTILKNNETGISILKNITTYDDFRGNITQGYRADYRGGNDTMVILVAQMVDNNSAVESAKDMVIRLGYNESAISDDNGTVIRLPYVDNPEVFVIQRENSVQHYVFTKRDKVYWVAFSKPKVMYVLNMLRDVYANVDEKLQDL